MEELYDANPHLNMCFDESDFALDGKVIYIPQAGPRANVVKNRTVIPAVATERVDGSVMYEIDWYSIDPQYQINAKSKSLAYDKVKSLLFNETETLTERAGDEMLIKWGSGLPSDFILETSGEVVGSELDGQTGDRLSFIYKDLKRINTLFNKAKVPMKDRYAVLDPDMESQLKDSFTITQERDFSKSYNPETGVLGKLENFTFLQRASALITTDADEVLAYGATTPADADAGSLFWQKNMVTKAHGEINYFDDMGNPLYFGDVYSADFRLGGRRRRADSKGVVIMKQAKT